MLLLLFWNFDPDEHPSESNICPGGDVGVCVLLLIVTTAKHRAGVRGLGHLYARIHSLHPTTIPTTLMPFGSGYLELPCTGPACIASQLSECNACEMHFSDIQCT